MQELISKLTAELGINEGQAKGGVGLLLKMAQDKLGGADFEKIKDAVPGAEALADAAPEAGGGESGGLMGMVGSIAGALGGEKLEGAASLAGGFDKLGLDVSMVGKFIPQVLEFLKSKGGGDIVETLEKLLGGGK
ncbi:MAG: DUF2780 domain-containing protein [Planctomycetota bacterium]